MAGSIELDTGGNKICCIEATKEGLFLGVEGEGGTIKSVHTLKEDKTSTGYSLSGGEIWSRRAESPLFERVALQFSAILNSGMTHVKKDNIEKIVDELIAIAFDLSKAEEDLIEYTKIEYENVLRYENKEGVKNQRSGIVFKDPTLILKELGEKILITLIIASRKLPTVISLITDKEFKPGKTFIGKLADELPLGHQDRAALEKDQEWMGELYFFRGEIEHKKWNILPFEINKGTDGSGYSVKKCRIIARTQGEQPIPLGNYLLVAFKNMFGFIEDAISLVLSDRIRYPGILVSLPESERPKFKHYRFVLDVAQEIKDKLPTAKSASKQPPPTE